ncbi:MAG: hypothetical protein ACK552_14400 [Microcystis sp.]
MVFAIVSGQNTREGECCQQSRHRSQAQELDLGFIIDDGGGLVKLGLF